MELLAAAELSRSLYPFVSLVLLSVSVLASSLSTVLAASVSKVPYWLNP